MTTSLLSFRCPSPRPRVPLRTGQPLPHQLPGPSLGTGSPAALDTHGLVPGTWAGPRANRRPGHLCPASQSQQVAPLTFTLPATSSSL